MPVSWYSTILNFRLFKLLSDYSVFCREDYLRAVRALLREIVRALRHELDFVALCRGLMTERKEALFQELESTIKVSSKTFFPEKPQFLRVIALVF